MRTCFPPDLYSLLLGQCLLHLVQPSAVQRTCSEEQPPEIVRAGGVCHPTLSNFYAAYRGSTI